MGATRLLGALLGSGAGSMLGGMVGGRGGSLVGSLLGSMLGGRASSGMGRGGGGAGALLGGLLGGGGDRPEETPENDATASVLIEAMCSAAKADGEVTQDEVDAILGELGDVDEADADYLRQQLATPLDLEGLIDRVPTDMATEAYAVSLLAIKVDTGSEVQYLSSLAEGLGLGKDEVDDIHDQLEAPRIFS